MRVLVTAGPTREPIDPVRFISNRSSGKMGYAIATACLQAGHEVTLISGPVCLPAPALPLVRVTTSDEMFAAVGARLADIDVLVMCAAVADFKPRRTHARKIKKENGLSSLALAPTKDILATIGALKNKPLLVGFAAETDAHEKNARQKLRAKNCDLLIANDAVAAAESDENELTLFFRSGEVRHFARENKIALARKLVKIFAQLAEKS